MLLFVVAALLAPVCLVFYAKSNEGTRPPSMLSVWFKIVVSAFAANSIAAKVFHWGDLTQSLFKTQGRVSSMGITYFSFACAAHARNSFVYETLVYLCGPFGLALASSVLFVFVAPKRSNLASTFRHAFRTMGVLIFYLVQPALTERAASLLACVQFSNDEW